MLPADAVLCLVTALGLFSALLVLGCILEPFTAALLDWLGW